MSEDNNRRLTKRLKELILNVDPEGVLRDARAAGLEVTRVEDFRDQAHNYWRIEDLMHEYGGRTARFSAASGATSGVGGVVTAVTLGSADIAHMAAQLYRLCQRLAILNGFDPENSLQRDRAQEIYFLALGFDTAAQVVLRQQLGRAANIAGKRGAYSNYIIRLIVFVAGKLGPQISSIQAAKFIPLVGGVFGATINYTFARRAANKMMEMFKDDYFRTWQAGNRGETKAPPNKPLQPTGGGVLT